MIAEILVFITFIGVVAVLLISYEKPAMKRKKITGRGGDFE
jgi:hypothetical protein